MGKWLRRTAAGGAVTIFGVALASVPAVATTSCLGTDCQAHTSYYGCPRPGVEPPECCNEGHIRPDGRWESSGQEQDWLNFPGSNTIQLNLGAWVGDLTPDQASSILLIAPAPPAGAAAPFPEADPPDAPVSYTAVGANNQAEWVWISGEGGPSAVEIYNSTCASTIVRAVIGFDTPTGGVPASKLGVCAKP
jgi:hypothetical protein